MRITRLSPDILFESAHLRKDLAQKTVRGGVTTITAQALQFLLHTGSTMILARLLSPADYGLVAMATVVTGFLTMFKDAGLNMATIQQENITRDQISTLFWINVIISTGLGLIILASAPLVGLFYKRPELVPVTAFLSINFALGGLTLQHDALLRRHMMFAAQRTILIGSMIIGIIVSIILAYYGFRYWSLVWGTLATSLVRIALTWFYCSWIPGRMKKGTGVRKMLKFGGHITAFNFINYFARNGDNLLIGKFIGANALGLYSKAYQVVYLPLDNVRNPINMVALPAMSKLQNDIERFRRYYKKIIFALAFFSMPLMAFCIMFPRELIMFLFGERWLGMTTVFRLLAIGGFPQTIIGTRGLLLLACGQSKIYLKLGIINALLAVVGFAIGLRWGINGVAASFIVVSYLPQYFLLKMVFRSTPGRFTDIFKGSIFPFGFTWIAAIFTRGLIHWLSLRGHIILFVAVSVMFILYIGMFFVVSTSRKELMEIFVLLKGNGQTNFNFIRRLFQNTKIHAIKVNKI